MNDVGRDDVVLATGQQHVISAVIDAQVNVWAGEDIVTDAAVEVPGPANDRAGELDDIHVNAVVNGDGASGRAAAEADDQGVVGFRMQDHRQMADAAVHVNLGGASAHLMIAVDGQRHFA